MLSADPKPDGVRTRRLAVPASPDEDSNLQENGSHEYHLSTGDRLDGSGRVGDGRVDTRAGAGGCHRCGCEGCQKVCRLVCDEKELEVNCWDSKCEEFCVPGHCKLGCKHCGSRLQRLCVWLRRRLL